MAQDKNPYRCVQNHYCEEQYDGKNCPYDKDNFGGSDNGDKLLKAVNEYNDNYLNKDEKLKEHYKWAVKNGKVSPLVSYDNYCEISNKLHIIAIGKKAADGTKIKKITNHVIDRVCGTTEKENGVKHEGVELSDFEYTLFNGKVRKTSDTNTIIFISDKCRIAVNPKNGAIKQCTRL